MMTNDKFIVAVPGRRQKIDPGVSEAILEGANFIRDGKEVVLNIGATTYVSFDDLTPGELQDLAGLRKHLGKSKTRRL
jgi:hypothetical protein